MKKSNTTLLRDIQILLSENISKKLLNELNDKVIVTNKDTGNSYEVSKDYYNANKSKYDIAKPGTKPTGGSPESSQKPKFKAVKQKPSNDDIVNMSSIGKKSTPTNAGNSNFSNILENDMNERLQSSVESAKQQLKQAEHSFKVWTEAMAPKIEFFRTNESEIINLLKEHKFAFDEKEPMRCSPVGDSEWRKHHDPTEHCSLHIDAPLKMKDRSPVSSDNARRISWELEEAFEKKFGGKIVCSLNPYSLDRKNRILFELWVK